MINVPAALTVSIDETLLPAGAPGADGTNGLDGTNGTNGVDGTNGLDGEDGADGEDGLDAIQPTFTSTVETLPAGSLATAGLTTVDGVNYTLALGIPQGQPGSGGGGVAGVVNFFVALVNPTASDHANGDFRMNAVSGDVFEKVSGSWVLRGNLRGPKGDTGPAPALTVSSEIDPSLSSTQVARTQTGPNAYNDHFKFPF